VVRRIRVGYTLRLAQGHREAAERVHGFHQQRCPVARTLRNCVDITTSLRMEDS
jgi:uncharacterized OsmC-like protein